MPEYQNGKIYKIVNSIDDKIYVGSTVTPLEVRFSDHRRSTNDLRSKLATHMNEKGTDSFSIMLLENYPCESKIELEQRERFWFEQLKPELNTKTPRLTADERIERAQLRAKLGAIKSHCDVCNCDIRSADIKEHNMSNKHRVNQGLPPYRKRY